MAVVHSLESGQGRAAETAIACIGARLDRSIEETIAICDIRLRHLGGVSLAIAVLDIQSGSVSVATVGSVRVALFQGDASQLSVPCAGAVGRGYEGVTPNTWWLSSGDVLAIYSEGSQQFLPAREALLKASVAGEDQTGALLEQWAEVTSDAALLIYRHDEQRLV